MALTPILINAGTRRAQIHEKAVEGVQNVFPLEARGHVIEVDNVRVLPKDYSSKEQKEAILNGHTLQEPLKADVVMRDTTTGKIVQSKPGLTLAQVPWFTPRHTFIVDGNEYSVGNQRRVRPGVYTRVRGNEELEAAFNLGRGENFRISMDPAKGHMYLQYGTTNIPLYPVLKHLGVTDGELNKAWGSGVVVQNKGAFGSKSDKALDKLYERLVPEYRRTHQTPEAKADAIHESYRNTLLDPIVTERTLGEGFTHVTPSTLVKASQKMLNVHREGAETDDRDNLAVQSLHSVDDFLRERIQLEGRNLAKKIKMKASMTATPDLDRILPPSPFTRTLRGFITQSSLSAIPTQINPVEIIDSATRVTTLGEGGIESERAIPNEARQLHHTHFGFIDPARTPESFKAGVDLRASLFLQRDAQGRMYTKLTNVKTGKDEDVPVHQVENATVAFPGETKKKTGVSALKGGQLVSVSRKDVDYELPHPNLMFSVATNMVPMLESVQGNRILMGAKHSTQALPLIHREQPLVQVASFNPGRTMEQEIAGLVVPHAPVAGVIKKIDDDYVYLQPTGKKHAAAPMPFPGHEHQTLKKRLDTHGVAYTTRTDTERTQYRPGQEWATPWGHRIRIEETTPYQKLRQHPFYDELTSDERQQIGTQPFILVKFRKVDEKTAGYRFPALAPVETVWTTDDDIKYAEVPVPDITPMSGVDQPQNDSGAVCDRCNDTATTKVMYNNGASFKPSCANCAEHIKEKLGDSFSGFRAFEKNGEYEDTPLEKSAEDRPHTFTHKRLGVTYDVPKLWTIAQQQPIKQVAVADLEPILHQRMWKNLTGKATPAIHSQDPYHRRKVEQADLKHPIILHPDGTLMDGAHRLMKAYQQGLKTIGVVKLTKEPTAAQLTKHAAMAETYERHGHAHPGVGSVLWHFHNYEHGYGHCRGGGLNPYEIHHRDDGNHAINREYARGHGIGRIPTWFHFSENLGPGQWKLESGRQVNLSDVPGQFKHAAAENLIKIPYDSNYPLASKTYLHNTLIVKPGDEVDEDQHLAESNFTRDGRMALGTNLNVGYLAHYGANTNDAVVISESAAEKLTSEHMYKEAQPLDDDIELSLNKHRALYGSRWTAQQYGHLDSRGVAKAGEVLNPGDPIFLAIRKTAPTAEQQMLGKLHRGLATPYREVAHTWDHRCPGTVTDVVVTPQRLLVTIKTQESAAIGDKISNRYGGKGVVSKVIPDGQMPRLPSGQPLDLLMPPTGVHGRINPAQVIETALAKVARKTGEPIVMEAMSGRNNVEYAKKMLKEHGLTDKEILENPITGKKITGVDGKGVMVGPQYIYKLFKSTETNYSARGVEDYDVNLQPAKGGASGAKALGRMELNALLAHNARNVLQEVSTLKSTKNDEFWRAYQLGLPPPPVRTSFASEKLMEMLRGSGIKVDKSAQHMTLGPMTDADVRQMSSGAISKPLMVKEKDLTPEKGGLFDPVVTGGTAGTRWAHVDLHEPIVNPVFEDPVRRLLGMTENEFRGVLQQEGGKGVQRRLAKLDLDKHAGQLREEIRDASGARLDNIVKQLKAVQALKQQDLTPDKAYVLSKLPIVPPVVRPILPSKGRRDLLVADANYLYRDAMLANDTLADAKRVLPEEEVGKARLQLYDATKAVFGLADPTSPQLSGRGAKGFISTITGQGSPKHGFFHGKVLYRPQDLSGRGTVAPDLTLDMDEIGLPEDMLWTTYAPHLVRRLVQNGYKAVDAKQMVDDRHPAAGDMLAREIKERPVFVNRAPTLHRYNLIGAYPVSVPGKTIRVNPFMEKGMGMDYDGDTLQVHVPVGNEAVKEVRSMTLSNLLFGDKSKNNLLVFPQHEAILGIHMASAAQGGEKHRFKTNADAIAAYKRGELKLTDVVEIG